MTLQSPEQFRTYEAADVATRELLLNRIKALQPMLRRNAGQTEKDRRVVEENILEMSNSGLFRAMVPRRFDGFESSIRTHLELTAAVAESCPSTAWVLALTNVCAWLTGLCSSKLQDEVFGANPYARVAGVFSPTLESKRVEGGLVMSGKWYWSSGILHADWALLGVIEKDEKGGVRDQYLAWVPMSELTIEDTWYVAGMKGTGSNCVVGKDVFVPDHRLLSLPQALQGKMATEWKEEIPYRAAIIPTAALILVGAQLGMARASLAYVIEKAAQRSIAYTSFQKQTDSVSFQIQVANAAMKVDTAHLHAYRAAQDIDQAALRGEVLEYKTRARVRADTGIVAQFATDAINMLMTAHGAGSFGDASPLQRYWRDSNTAARHAIVLQPVADEVYGKALLGIENTVTPLV